MLIIYALYGKIETVSFGTKVAVNNIGTIKDDDNILPNDALIGGY